MTTTRLDRLNRFRGWWSLAALALVVLVPRVASAVQGAELYRTEAYFYGRFEARIRFAPGEGVVSSFFLWRDGSSSTTSWNELDFEKANATCKLQTNIWTGKGTQSATINTPSFNVCSDYHTYGYEWTPDYIAWFIDGSQIRKVTGASVTEYTTNASQGMSIHFNIWAGNSTFGGVLDPSILPVQQYISWVQYSSYSNGAFQQQWREEFDSSSISSDWGAGTWASPYNLSTHNPANITLTNGIAVLSMTADNATGYSGTPPVDSMASSSGTGGTTGTGGTSASGGTSGSGGTSASGGKAGGSGGTQGSGGSSSSSGGSSSSSGGSSSSSGGSSSSTGGSSSESGGTSGGSKTGGTSGSGGALGSGGSSGSTSSGSGGLSGTGGTNASTGSGSGGSEGGSTTGANGSSGGCSAGGDRPSGNLGLFAALSIAAGAFFSRRRRVRQR